MPKKDPGQFTLFPETLYEYHILLSPGGSVIEDVDNLKQQLDSMIGLAPHNLSSIAHITLHNFVAYESVNVKDDVKKAVAGLKSFTVKLAGHAHFEQGRERTLYLKIDNPQPIDALAERIISPKKARKEAVRQTSILDNPRSKPKAPKSINPHVTIARNIPVADFERIFDFTAFDYHNEWLCDRITLRRRIAGTTGRFSPYGVVKLG